MKRLFTIIIAFTLFLSTTNIQVYGAEQWKAEGNLPIALGSSSVVYANDKLYVFGGDLNAVELSNKVYIYNLSTKVWTQGATMPSAKAYTASVLIGSKVYLIGGFRLLNKQWVTIKDLDIYDIDSNTWTNGATLLSDVGDNKAFVIGSEIYLFGGSTFISNARNTRNIVQIYNIKNNTWRYGEPMPDERENYTLDYVQDKIYLIGGRNNSTHCSDVNIYNTITHTWSKGNSMTTARRTASSVAYNNKIYVIDGILNSTWVHSTEIYDIETNTWTTGVYTNKAKRYAPAILIGSKIYRIGGVYSTGYTNTIETFQLPEYKITNIDLSASKNTIDVNEELVLKASIYPLDASNKELKWLSSNPQVAEVNTNGVVKGKNSGLATITVKAADGSNTYASIAITVKEPQISVIGLDITAEKDMIYVGETLPLHSEIKPANASNKAITWASSNTEAAVVSSNGIITGIKEGTVTITATTVDGGYESKFDVLIRQKEIEQIAYNLEIVLVPKEQIQLSISDDIQENENLTWSSSNPAVASIDSMGKLTAHTKGQSVITVTNEMGTYTEEIHVLIVGGDIVGDYRLAIDLRIGEKCRLTFDGNTGTKKVLWASRNDDIATITDNGKVTAESKGLALITAKDEKGNEKQVYVRVR